MPETNTKTGKKREKRRKRGHGRVIALVVVAALVVFCAAELLISKYGLTVTEYGIGTEKISDRIRMVQLTDLHNSEFGKDNGKLVERVEEQEPDLILVTGDLLNSDEERTDAAVGLLQKLVKIAPVYVSLGNNEVEYEENYGTDIKSLYEETGATVLEREYQDIAVNGQEIRIGGIYGYCLPAKYLKTREADPVECRFLEEMQKTDHYTILMCHMPVCWLVNDGINEWDMDLVVAGHAHGGQIRIPFVGGLWAPDQGWFPGKESGLYRSTDGTKLLELSRGLGSNEVIPRFNNVPEIAVIDLMPVKG